MSDSLTGKLCSAIQTEVRSILEHDTAIAGITQTPGETLKAKARNIITVSSDQLPEVSLKPLGPDSPEGWQLHITAGVFVRSLEPVPSTLDRLSAEITTKATSIISEADSQQHLDTSVTLVAVSVVS